MDQVQKRGLWDSARRTIVGSIAVAAVTLICFEARFDFAAAIPIFLLLVILHSLTGDFRSSAIISVLAASSLNYYFLDPLFSLRISDQNDIVALLVFLVTALIITKLVARVRLEARSSKRQKDRLDRLYRLSQELLTLGPEDAGEKLLGPFQRLFGVTALCVLDAATADVHVVGSSENQLADRTRDAYIAGQDRDDPASRISVRRLQIGSKTTGAIGFEGLKHPEETAGPLAALAAAHLERTRAFRSASTAAAAAQAEGYRSAMLDALAHEFKTPLATILAAAGGLREAGPLASEQLEMAETVENEAARLGSLTSRLLRTARLDSEEIRPRMEMIDLSSLIAHIAAQYSARSPDRQIVLTNRREAVDVFADPELLRLTLNQLIENACKYSQPGSTVAIDIERQDDFIAVKVSNSGSSIPFHERSRIFERFYRGAEAKRSTAGSGLGLYVARKIALAHGGALDLETEQPSNNAVTFCLKIPCIKEEVNHAVTVQ